MTYCIIKAITKQNSRLCKDNKGVAMIEFAVMLPIFLMLAFGVIEFGMWFYESEITNAAVSNITQAIENNPNITTAQLQQMVDLANNGLSRLSFYDPASNAGSKNYICVKPYKTAALATAGKCSKTDLSATDPNAGGAPYAVAIDAYVAPNALTPLGNFIHTITPTTLGINDTTAVAVGTIMPPTPCANTANAWGILQFNPSAIPEYSCAYIPIPAPVTPCDGPGQALQFINPTTGYQCETVTPPVNCTQAWQNLEWNGTTGKWACPSIPYVFAGGIAHASTSPPGFWATGSPMTTDETWVAWTGGGSTSVQLNRNAICTAISFKVPANLPAGQIIAQGNLIYPGSNNDGRWHGWSVSFAKLDTGPTPPTGSSTYNGSAYLCMDNGGNWTQNNSSNVVASESQSWTITFIPN